MRTLLLTTLLALTPAAAQTSIPATPPSTTPTTPAPATPAPVTPTPATPAPTTAAPVTPTAPTLNLTAPVGASVEMTSNTVSRTSVSNIQVTALPGSKVSEAKLNEIRRSLTGSTSQMNQAITMTGKAYFKVAARDATSSTTLVSTIIQNVPGEKPITLKFTQNIARDGKVSGMKVESDNAMLKAMFQNLNPEKMEQFANQNGSNFTNVYAQPLTVGQPRTETLSIDAENLLSDVFNAIANEQNAQELAMQVQSTPLVVTTITTYQGLNAAGLHEFQQTSSYANWKVTIPGKGNLPNMSVELGKVDARSTQSYRRDGLPGNSTQTMNMPMTLTMTIDGVQVKFTMTVEQTTTLKLK